MIGQLSNTMKTSGNFRLRDRQAGILMPVSALSSRHGIGDLGQDAYDFADIAVASKFKIWQILPLNPLGYGNSPYQPYSSFAGDEIYINLDLLKEEGLLEEVPSFQAYSQFIKYDEVREFKESYLRKAFKNFKETEDYKEFISKAFWLEGYALFRARKKINNQKCWLEWETLDYDQEEVLFHYFVQYYFYRQWMSLKSYANGIGLTIMGDMPIYVGLDSADVYDNKECFLLDKTGHPTSVAGVPPDYFSADGQLWGNPLYVWDYLKDHKYSFWMNRLSWNKDMFDLIRIDHFRAFDTYWKIPSGDTTAKNGKWVLGPSYDFFDYVYKKFSDINLVAEDLGDLRPEVIQLKDHYQMLGMRVAQFSFDDDMKKDNYQLPDFCIGYTGTHDNAPINGWYHSLSKIERKKIRAVMNKLQFHGKTMADRVINYILAGKPIIAIIMMQDILGYGMETRINTPSTIGEPNWCFKLRTLDTFKRKQKHIIHLLTKYNRL